MGIKVESVTPRGGTLLIRFAEPFLGTDEGYRALRVLFMHAKHDYSVDGNARTLRLDGGADISVINTRAALQAELDRYADAPVKVTFGKPLLGATGSGPTPKTRADIRAVRRAGRKVWVQMKVTASMPLIRRDERRLNAFVPGGVRRINDDLYSYWIVVVLHGDHETSNPWTIINRLKPQIQAAIV